MFEWPPARSVLCRGGGSCLISSTAEEGLPPSAEFPLPSVLPLFHLSDNLIASLMLEKHKGDAEIFAFSISRVLECECVYVYVCV